MKTKLVLWGQEKDENKILVALELKPTINQIRISVVPAEVATEELYKQLMSEWRDGKEVVFPESTTHEDIELTITGALLPEGIQVDKPEVVQRAQTEWHFVVLSTKLNQQYQAELETLDEKITLLETYSQEEWEGLKVFWAKVQEQMRDRNLLRNHANILRDHTNELFAKLKNLRSIQDAEFYTEAEERYNKFVTALDNIDERIANNASWYQLFDDLKRLQRDFRSTKLTRDLRTKVWNRLDGAFKTVKEKRFGSSANTSPYERVKRRYDGLLTAIDKMKRSIKRDNNDLEFEDRKVNSSFAGQLETQIRQAKIKMIQERVGQKMEKLSGMEKTLVELEEKLKGIKEKERKRAAREKRPPVSEAPPTTTNEVVEDVSEKEIVLPVENTKIEEDTPTNIED